MPGKAITRRTVSEIRKSISLNDAQNSSLKKSKKLTQKKNKNQIEVPVEDLNSQENNN
jgi:hypothetical protein